MRQVRLRGALRRVVLLRETGPKSAIWHRARVATIWRLHQLIEQAAQDDPDPAARGQEAPSPSAAGRPAGEQREA